MRVAGEGKRYSRFSRGIEGVRMVREQDRESIAAPLL
jgi:hypothetical protein